MTDLIARLAMILAIRSLGEGRDVWAEAMAAEYQYALQDGRPLRFATGCLAAAWRMLPAHAEGRYILSSYALCLCVLVPMATMLAMAALFGFPFVAAGDGIDGYLSGGGTHHLLLNDGTRTLAPALTLLMALMAAYHLPLAWWMLDRDWERVGAASRLGAAAAMTLVIISSFAALDASRLLLPLGAMAAELIALAALSRWHDRLLGEREYAV